MCVIEIGRERERMCVCVCVRGGECMHECVCVCMCVCMSVYVLLCLESRFLKSTIMRNFHKLKYFTLKFCSTHSFLPYPSFPFLFKFNFNCNMAILGY